MNTKSELELQLEASLVLVALKKENDELRQENRLLQARLDAVALQRLKASRNQPALLRAQAE